MSTPHVLHVGSGFRPLRWGGLVAYIEDLSAEQVKRGWQVSYLFSGRYYRRPRKLRLKRWRRGDVAMLEVVNSPLHDHGRQPELEISEPGIERLFAEALAELRPDVVHVQELAGLPFSVLEVARRAGFPVVMTLQDYFPLCPTFKLIDADGQVCLRREIGSDCLASIQADQRRPSVMFEVSAWHDLVERSPLRRLPARLRDELATQVSRPRIVVPRAARRIPDSSPASFQRRRDVILEILAQVDRLIGMSTRVTEIYQELGVDRGRLTTLQLTLAHIERLTPRRERRNGPLTFATLGGGESVPKGTAVLLQALTDLARVVEPNSFRLLVFGRCERTFEAALRSFDNVERRPPYRPADLNEILEEVDVGLMPSVWEEAYGYAGMEFIAKGIPVIANPIGGMTDYVREGETGWLNQASSGRALAVTMRGLIQRPERVAEVTRTTKEARDELVLTIAEHATAVEAVYREVGAL